jgi:hypothetical protein
MDRTMSLSISMEGDDVVVRFSSNDYPAEVAAFNAAFERVMEAEDSDDAALIDEARRELNKMTVALLEAPLITSKRAYGLS